MNRVSISVNPGSGRPFVSVATIDEDGNQAHLYIHPTPKMLRATADQLETELRKVERRKAIEAQLDAEDKSREERFTPADGSELPAHKRDDYLDHAQMDPLGETA